MLIGLSLILLDLKQPRMANFLPALLIAPLLVVVAGWLGIGSTRCNTCPWRESKAAARWAAAFELGRDALRRQSMTMASLGQVSMQVGEGA